MNITSAILGAFHREIKQTRVNKTEKSKQAVFASLNEVEIHFSRVTMAYTSLSASCEITLHKRSREWMKRGTGGIFFHYFPFLIKENGIWCQSWPFPITSSLTSTQSLLLLRSVSRTMRMLHYLFLFTEC